jgi:outer membrane protein assembly factor BamA
MFVERQFFEEDVNGVLVKGGNQRLSVTSPSVSLVGDNTLFGYYGPVNGGRYNLTFSPSFPVFGSGLSYQTGVLDVRRYWNLTRGHTFAARGLVGVSGGQNPQTFEVGGFSTLRGYDDFSIFGSRMALANIEYRFPFIQQLGLVGPLPLGFFNLRGVGFVDFGDAWYQNDSPRLSSTFDGRRHLQDLKVGYGTGIRSAMSFFIVKLDVAWSTDFVANSKPRWYFSIGPEF